MVTRASWIPAFNIQYLVGIDGLSFPLVILSTFICMLSAIASWNIEKMAKGYWALFLFLETGILGVFLSLDFFLFYVFWELTSITSYLLIGVDDADPEARAAAQHALLVTGLGGLVMLAGEQIRKTATEYASALPLPNRATRHSVPHPAEPLPPGKPMA